ncbi:MAG: glutamate 5-kinase [Clostridia bacterium]|nr:glutamate 5-kinase [Clostridia bacterium]
MKQIIDAKRIVIKIGSSTLTYQTGLINLRRLEQFIKVLSDLKNSGREIILVSSGAVSAGSAKLGFSKGTLTTEQKQATAAVGQSELMRMYSELFSAYGHTVAQILITKDVIDDEHLRHNAQNTLQTLISMNCIPIINENDTISTVELNFGGNDPLSAYVAILCHADLLINMSDVDGLFSSDPRTDKNAKRIEVVDELDEEIMAMASGTGTSRGTGGMVTKLEAAGLLCAAEIPMMIVNGENPDILYDIFDGKKVGTYFRWSRK